MLAPPPPIIVSEGMSSSSEGGGVSTYLNQLRNRISTRHMIYAGTVAFTFLVAAFLITYLLKNYQAQSRRELRRLETPPAMAAKALLGCSPMSSSSSATTAASTMSTAEYPVTGLSDALHTPAATNNTAAVVPPVSTSALFQARPYSPSKPDDYFGIIEVTSRRSATLTINLTANTHGYSEVVVYRYPEWTVIFAETCISELSFDFLPVGTYTAIVYAIAPVEGVLETCRNRKRPAPTKHVHRTASQMVSDMRNASADSVVSALAPAGAGLMDTIQSEPVFVWPGTVYTRVETLSAIVSPDTTAAFVSLPAYGFVVEGASEHLGPLVHEGNSTAIYRAVVKEAAVGTGGGAGRIQVTVVYPDVDPKSPSGTSPTTTLYVFGPRHMATPAAALPRMITTSDDSEG